ncbi:T9SS type A sorting domain-containing protein [Bacteroidota bacterium]
MKSKFSFIIPALVLLMTVITIKSIGQNSCITAVELDIDTLFDYEINDYEFWGTFEASDTLVKIMTAAPQSGTYADIDFIVLFGGDCYNLTPLDTAHVSESDSIVYYNELTIDNIYYIKVHQATSQTAYFGLYVQTSGIYVNNPIYCPVTTGCENLVPNHDFDPSKINVDLWDFYISGMNWGVYDDPFGLNITPLSNVCGWGKGSESPQLGHPFQLLNNFYLYMWAWKDNYNDHYESVYTEINNGQNLTPGNYIFRFKYREAPNSNNTPEKIASGLDQDPYSFGITPDLVLTDDNTTFNFNGVSWEQFEMNFSITSQQTDFLNLYFYPIPCPTCTSNAIACYINIDDIEIIYMSLQATPSTTICDNEEVTIEVVCPKIFDDWSVAWSSNPTDNTLANHPIYGDQTSNPIIYVQPNQTTTYTATITSPTGLVSTEDITITVNQAPAAPVIEGNRHTCEGNTSYSITDYNGSYTYSYEVTTGTSTTLIASTAIGSSSFNIDWDNYVNNFINCRAELMVTVEDGNCSEKTTIVIYQCCTGGGYDEEWTDEEVEGNYSGSLIAINGIVTITAGNSLEIHNCTIKMGGNARIYIEANADVLMDDNTLIEACCDNMWDCIFLEDENAYLELETCTITDGIMAVYSFDGGEYNIMDCIFDENYYHIFHGQYTGTHNGFISGNTFDNSSQILGLYPHIGDETFSCLFVKDVSGYLVIGDESGSGSSYENTFRNAQYGIFATNSNLKIRNNNFEVLNEGIHYIGNDNDPYYQTPELIIGGSSSNQSNYFNEMNYGIYTDYKADIQVYNNFFESISYAVAVTNNKRTEINIVGNTIDYNTEHGIYIINVASEININKNTINTAGSTLGTTGIYVAVNQDISNPVVSIKTNICNNTIDYSKIGIYASDALELMISSNEISIPASPTTQWGRGIWVNDLEGADIQRNEISYGTTPNQSCVDIYLGIKLEYFETGYIRHNDVSYFGSGLRPVYLCTNSEISCNYLFTNYYGMYFQDNLLLMNQGSSNETWDNEWDQNVSNYDITGDYSFQQDVWYYYNSGNYAINENVTGQMIFSTGSQSNPIYCSNSIPNCDSPPQAPLLPITAGLENERDRLLGKILNYFVSGGNSINASVSNNLYSSNFSYDMARYAFSKLKAQPLYLNIGSASDSLYQQLYNAISNTNIADFSLLEDKITDHDNVAAVNILNSIYCLNNIENTIKTVYEVFLRSWFTDSLQLSSDDSATLLQIAYLSPSDYGKAVFLARNMLNIFVLDNEQQGSPKSSELDKTEMPGVKIYPNPARNQLNVEFDAEMEYIATFTFYSILGEKISQIQLLPGKSVYSFALPDLKDGIYFYEITSPSMKKEGGKLIISK